MLGEQKGADGDHRGSRAPGHRRGGGGPCPQYPPRGGAYAGVEVTELGERWDGLLTLLRAHGDHEDQHILRLLDSYDPFAAEPIAEQHRDLDDLLDDLAERFETVLAAPRIASGLDLYRDLARFVAAYLTHMHDEETRVMGRIWACCTDQEIAGARQRFMAGMSPRVQALSIEYTLPALDEPTRTALEARLKDAAAASA